MRLKKYPCGCLLFWQSENLIHFTAFKKHISISPSRVSAGVSADRFADYHKSTEEGNIPLPLDKPIPYDLIADITWWRIKQAERATQDFEIAPKKLKESRLWRL